MLSYAEENYLKTIYHLSEGGLKEVSTNAIAEELHTKAASVTDMIKRLAHKGMLSYKKYKGVNVSPEGKKGALTIIRKHRLWETFLVEQLKFHWAEVHEIAEQLEHIKSPLLIRKLDEFLGFPKYDPHGDPIPDEDGEFTTKPKKPLSTVPLGDSGTLVSVKDDSPAFLKYLDKNGLYIGAHLNVLDKVEFDGSLEVCIDTDKTIFVSKKAAENLLISK